MSTPARQALDRHATPWLFACALVTTLPHFLHQPAWLSALAGLLLTWSVWLWWKDERMLIELDEDEEQRASRRSDDRDEE